MKYCLYSLQHYPEAHVKFPITGLFHWKKALGGVMGAPADERLRDFDILHVNMTTGGQECLSGLRAKIGWPARTDFDKPSTKIIVNVDYAIQMWSAQFPDPDVFQRNLDLADFIFHVEEEAAKALSVMLGRHVYWIPHPVDVEVLNTYSTPDRKPMIWSFVHRYFQQWMGPWLVGRDLGLKNVGCLFTSAPPAALRDNMVRAFDMVMPYAPFPQFIKQLSQIYAAIESYNINSYGRVTAECAALGVPAIGASTVGSLKQCFPMLTTAVGDFMAQRKLLIDLINDQPFWRACVEAGRKNVKFYSMQNSKKRMLDALEDAGIYTRKAEDYEATEAAKIEYTNDHKGGITL